MIFSAMATGGAIVSSQYIGRKDINKACIVANQLILTCIIVSTVLTVLCLGFNNQILSLIYGKIDSNVMTAAITYFYITALSFPFLALYNGCAALFRSMSNSKISMNVSIIMNIINVVGNFICIYIFKMGVVGVAVPTLLSRIVAAIILMILIRNKNLLLHVDSHYHLGFDLHIIKRIFAIGIPNGLENGMFQIGKLMTQSLISTLGTASIAANAAATTVEKLATIPAMAINLAIVTVVGVCVGAKKFDQVNYYTKKLIKTAYICLIGLNIMIIMLSQPIASLYNLSNEAMPIALSIIIYHSCCAMTIWPMSFTLANVLRATGDVKYMMTLAIVSMWIFRIGFSYIFVMCLNIGALGVWIAMTIDWLFRAIMNFRRFKSNKWQLKAVV